MTFDLVGYVTSSDSIKIGRASFDYSFDPGVVDPGSVLRNDICPSKPKGKLLLDLDLSKFGLQGIDFHATANGKAAGTTQAGAPLIEWTVDQQIDKYLPAFDVTLERVSGKFLTSVEAIDPAVKAASCEGPDRNYGAFLATTGSSNTLVVKVHKDILGVSHGGTATISNFAFDAVVGEPRSLAVMIKVPGNPCNKPIVEGGQADAYAFATGIPQGVTESYSWRVEGGVPLGPTNQWKLKFTTPTTETVFVSVEVTAGNQTAFNTTMVFPIPVANLPMLQVLCDLRGVVRLNLFVDPLWDPLRGRAVRPFSPADLHRLHDFAGHLSRLANELGRLTRGSLPAR